MGVMSGVSYNLLICLLLIACAPQTEYDRQSQLAEARDEFTLRERDCLERGGYMVITRYSVRGEPRAEELRAAKCGRL